ncbi:MAG: flagellar biosynthesis regulator FlaF [Pseudolabrys sp.]
MQRNAAAKAYSNVAKEISSARDLEAELLLRSAARFQSIRDGWEGQKAELGEALLFNRRLWTIFMGSLMRDDNPLPAEIRRNVVSLGVFVMNRTIKLTGEPKPEGLNTLININRELAAGLLARG